MVFVIRFSSRENSSALFSSELDTPEAKKTVSSRSLPMKSDAISPLPMIIFYGCNNFWEMSFSQFSDKLQEKQKFSGSQFWF